METHEVEALIGDKKYKLPVTFKAAMEVTKKVGDPLNLIRLWTRGDDSWMTTLNTIKILRAGMDTDLDEDELGEIIFEHGQLNDLNAVAGEYVAALASSGKVSKRKSKKKVKDEP